MVIEEVINITALDRVTCGIKEFLRRTKYRLEIKYIISITNLIFLAKSSIKLSLVVIALICHYLALKS